MGASRRHRGPHPGDEQFFSPDALPLLRQATAQLRGRRLNLDGFNLLIVLESALSGAVLQRGRLGAG